ncbi:MAG: AIR synthase family protein [archaeon]
MGFPLGKIPPKPLVEIVYKYMGAKRSDVVLGPSHGEDAAIVRAGGQLFVLKCDPISGAVSRIGSLSVHVSANDIATRGVRPAWFLSCIMLPRGSREKVLRTICRQMGEAAEKIGVAIVGGHSEVTPGLDHPLIIGVAAGTVGRRGYVTCSGAKPGSKIILTKGAGIEGTAILASDRAKPLARVFGRELIKRSIRFFDRISVVEDAMIAFHRGSVLAMHDPTEGGVAGGLNELANASRTGFRVFEKAIEVAPETERICKFFRIDPLKLIGSGSLLVIATDNGAEGIVTQLGRRGISAAIIGDVLQNNTKRILVKKDGKEKKLPLPRADDLWTALERKV